MRNLVKFKDCFLYLAFIILIAVALFKQIQPRFITVINLFREIKTQNEVKASMDQQLLTAAAKVAQKKKLRMGNDMVKKMYTPLEGEGTDTESAFSVLLDDVIEIAKKNHIKTHSIQSSDNPQDDVFVKKGEGKYNAQKLSLKIVSDYSDFEGFFRDLFSYNYLININELEIYPYEKNKKILLIDLTITLYSSKGNTANPHPKGEPGAEGGSEAPPPNP